MSEAIEKSSRAGKTAAKARWDREKGRAAGKDDVVPDAAAIRSHSESQFQQKDRKRAPNASRETTQARAKEKQSFGDFEDDVRAAERDLCIGRAA